VSAKGLTGQNAAMTCSPPHVPRCSLSEKLGREGAIAGA